MSDKDNKDNIKQWGPLHGNKENTIKHIKEILEEAEKIKKDNMLSQKIMK